MLLAALSLALGCGASEFRTPLPGGYTLHKTHGPGTSIWGLVPPDVVDFDVLEGRYFVGRIEASGYYPEKFPTTPGHFLADSRTGAARLGLTEAEWRDALADAGLDRDADVSGIPFRYNTSPAATLFRWVVWATLGLIVLAVVGAVVLRKLMPPARRYGRAF